LRGATAATRWRRQEGTNCNRQRGVDFSRAFARTFDGPVTRIKSAGIIIPLHNDDSRFSETEKPRTFHSGNNQRPRHRPAAAAPGAN
jgi:hypothetical protein